LLTLTGLAEIESAAKRKIVNPMSVALYMDTHVHATVTEQLRRRHVDLLTAQDDDCGDLDDEELLSRSTTLGRVLFTFASRPAPRIGNAKGSRLPGSCGAIRCG
jgi:hypothetical protein